MHEAGNSRLYCYQGGERVLDDVMRTIFEYYSGLPWHESTVSLPAINVKK